VHPRGTTQTNYPDQLPRVESKALSKNRRAQQRLLLMCIQTVYSFQIIVPVVQRIEQGFPKRKMAFLQEFAHVISSEQMTAFKRVE
jgi:hypothetical protein